MSRRPPLAMHLPPAPLLRRYVVRALLLWAGVRACFAMALLVGGAPEWALESVRAPGPQTALFVALTGALAIVDLSRASARVFLGNLGVSRPAMAVVYLFAATGGEVVRAAVVGAT